MKNAEEIVNIARNSFNAGTTVDYEFRITQLKALLQLIEENQTSLEENLIKDMQRPKFEAVVYEIETVKNEIKNIIYNLKDWMNPTKAKKSLMFAMDKVIIYPEPYGVTLIIGAWNYPLLLIIGPFAGALSAGNCVIMKPSEVAPNTGKLLEELFPKYLNTSCYQVVNGGIHETTQLLEQRFDYIFYTGSSSVGKIIYKAASKYLTPVTLELGGKSPVYLDNTVDVEIAAGRILWGRCVNSGQSCIAPEYILCSKDVEGKFIEAAKKQLKKWYGENVKDSPDFGRIANGRHFQRVLKLLQGSKIAVGGNYNAEEYFIEPTIVHDVKANDPIMQEEVFGPIISIINVESAAEAIKFINDHEKPLALYVFTNDKLTQDLFLKYTSSGNVTINDTMVHFNCDSIPFGGVGNSGIGAYHGKFTFDTFSHPKGTVIKTIDKIGEYIQSVRYPPYTSKKLNFISSMIKKRPNRFSIKCFSYILTFGFGIFATLATKFLLNFLEANKENQL